MSREILEKHRFGLTDQRQPEAVADADVAMPFVELDVELKELAVPPICAPVLLIMLAVTVIGPRPLLAKLMRTISPLLPGKALLLMMAILMLPGVLVLATIIPPDTKLPLLTVGEERVG